MNLSFNRIYQRMIAAASTVLAIVVGTLFTVVPPALAQDITDNPGINLGDNDLPTILVNIVNVALGIAALISVGFFIYAGFLYVTAAGREEVIEKAKNIIRYNVIGLVLIFASWGIVIFLISTLIDVTDTGSGGFSGPGGGGSTGSSGPFYVDHTNPDDGDEDVPLCHIVAATFSFPLSESSVTADSFQVTIPQDSVSNPAGGLAAGESCTENKECLSGSCSTTCQGDYLDGSFDFSESSYSAVFYPASDYEENTTYEVTLSTAIEGVDPDTGGVYSLESTDSKRNFNFTTGSTTDVLPPTVNVRSVAPYPVNGNTDICLNTAIQVTFSESLDPASPDGDNVWLYQYDGTDPSNDIDLDSVRVTSIGGNADDTIITGPAESLDSNTEYGVNLYSGDAATDQLSGAIYDTCGNALSGDFDEEQEGSPTDDFVDPTSAGSDQAHCTCTSGFESCLVDEAASSCSLDGGGICTLDTTCTDSHENYVGFDYQWTWTTGSQEYCVPEITGIVQEDTYYSEDEDPFGSTGSEDTDKVLITGNYLYPFLDVDFKSNVSAAGLNCFDADHDANQACFVSNIGSSSITLRTPVGSETGTLSVENDDGKDYSDDAAIIDSPIINQLSPSSGPVGQFITIKGSNFIDYDPSDTDSSRGQVFFDSTPAAVQCADGWDDDEIIVIVPDGFSADDTPNIQVVTTETKYSNQTAFTVTDGTPGPGLCEIVPSCSDTGADDITAIGESFGDSGTVFFDSTEGTVDASNWDVYNGTYDSQSIITTGTPVSEVDTYEFTASNVDGISNGIDFDITCSESPALFEYLACSPDQDLVYLPNPTKTNSNACVNSAVMFAFTNNMNNVSVASNTSLTRCNYGFDGDDGIPFDDSECTTDVSGSYATETLNDGYLGGSGSGTLDGTTDVNGDGDLDYYEGFVFTPDTPLDAGYFYKVDIGGSAQNSDGVTIASGDSWYFKVRNDATNCVADYLNLSPNTEKVTQYDAADLCVDNYESDGTDYSYRVRQVMDDCLLLDDAGTYDWTITNDDSGDDVIEFGTDDSPYGGTTNRTTSGYNSVCLQGQDNDNTGVAYVDVDLLDPDDLSVAVSSDTGTFSVDYGYCTQDSDCFTNECTDTYCDPTTNHCAPDITGFSPNNGTGADVGPLGCLTISGCYFGTDQALEGSCTCESAADGGGTCSVEEDGQTCILDGGGTCSLGEEQCTLTEECTGDSASAVFADDGGLLYCDCTAGNGEVCRVDSEEDTCVASGTETDICNASWTEGDGFEDGAEGTVQFGTTDADYPDASICGDTWDNNQVIAQVPATLPAGDYGITLSSAYYSDVDEEFLNDTYSSAEGDEDCTVGSDQTACLCQVDPDITQEGGTVDLYGEGFDSLVTDGGEKVTFAGSSGRVDADTATFTDDSNIEDVTVPGGAVSDEEGVQVESNTLQSNALDFTVSCLTGLDCATGCCSDNQCQPAEMCNTCTGDSDCNIGSCSSVCTDGICAPQITDISPDTGAVGQPVTVQGCFFGTYYDSTYLNESSVEFDGVEAPLACGNSDTWSNTQIIVTAPDGIFGSEDEVAQVVVNQVYGGGASTQDSTTANGSDDVDGDGTPESDDEFPGDADNDGVSDSIDPDHPAVFSQDNSCSEVDIPVLCDAVPAYSAHADGDTSAVDLKGNNFFGENDGYCGCTTDTLGACSIDNGDTATCSVTESNTYYVNSNDTTEECATTTTNEFTIYNGITGLCESLDEDTFAYVNPADESETCSDGSGSDPATSNDYTVYDSGDGVCVYTDPNHLTETCEIAVGDTSCSVCTIAEGDTTCSISDTESCSIDEDGDGTTDVCSDSLTSFVEQSGSVEYADEVEAEIDWGSYPRTDSGYEVYDVDVPEGSETGDVYTASILGDGSQCVSNGLEFPVTCSACSDCAGESDLNCNLNYGDGLPGICTADTSGFCRADGDSCCNNTSCVYDDALSEGDDPGTCVAQPLITDGNPDIDGENVCPNAEIFLEFNEAITTSDVFANLYNDEGIITGDDAAFSDLETYVELVDSTGAAVTLDDIEVSTNHRTITVRQSELLDFEEDYQLILTANDSIVSGADYQSGIVSRNTGAAAGCTPTQEGLGMCDIDGEIALSFTTLAEADFASKCGPATIDLQADSDEFIDLDHTFIESGQEEDFNVTVYSAGDDEIANTDDDQAITRIDDGNGAGFWWEYDWDDSLVFESLEDLEAASCPVAGIITGDDLTGSCSCSYEDTCDITEGDASCSITNGSDTLTCTTDSPSEVCDVLDSNYDEDSGTCGCTLSDSCTLDEGDSSCTLEFGEDTTTCTLDDACSADSDTYEATSFNEDSASQTVTADGVEETTAVAVTITGDGSSEDRWLGDLDDSQTINVLFCDNADYLTTYDNESDGTGANYNFYLAYCRGDDPQDDGFLPSFEVAFERSGADIATAYGSDQDFIYEVAFKDALAISNDPDANNNTIALRVYENDLDGSNTTVQDSIDPTLWLAVNTSTSNTTATEIDGYQAVELESARYIAGTNLDEDGSTSVPNALTPYMFVIAHSENASEETIAVVDAMVEHLDLNHNSGLAAECQLEKKKIVRDTKRVNDLGTISYLLSSYYYNDSDGDGSDNFPDVGAGSYIAGLTGSAWPSWLSTLGNELGQALPEDPYNTYDDAVTNCPYNPPDLSAGDDPSDTEYVYYDESGTCWDPVLKKYHGPVGSYLYHYLYNNVSTTSLNPEFELYANLEYDDTSNWQTGSYNPCLTFEDGTAVPTSISDFVHSTSEAAGYDYIDTRGCSTFNYQLDASDTTLDSTYGGNF